MDVRKKVYIETSVISNLTARPTYNLVDMARQVATQTWWSLVRPKFDLYASMLVLDEAARGDETAAQKRVGILNAMTLIPVTREMESLAERLLATTAVPRTSYEDAVHITAATVSGMDYLLTWNCRHIANAVTMPKIYKACVEADYRCPVICTPDQLGEENDDE